MHFFYKPEWQGILQVIYMKAFALSITHTPIFHHISVIFDITSITYFLVSFFIFETPLFALELFLGTYFLVEYILLFLSSNDRAGYVKHPLAMSNILIIIGYLAAPFWNVGFLRILRSFRIIHLYQIIPDIRMMTDRLMIWEKVLAVFFHVCVLVFILSEVIFMLQADINPSINSRFDAFYFTTNAITKVGSGETITLVDVQGQIITLIIAFLSLSVFVQLLDTAREVQKVRLTRKKGRKRKKETPFADQFCDFCDIKNRENVQKKKL